MKYAGEPEQADMAASVSDEFLAELVRELDHEDIVGMTLGGSYARGEATRYSDLDLACFWREGLSPPPKHFFYRQGRLISIKKTSVAEMRSMLRKPEAALFFARGKQRLLLDKDGSVAQFLQELAAFRWETLQPAANENCGFWMMLLAEMVHKVLRELLQENEAGLAYALGKLVAELTLVVALSRGVLILSDSTYFQQVEEAAGSASSWTYYHRIVRGLEAGPMSIRPLRARGLAVLHLYRETLALVRSVMYAEQIAVAEQALKIVAEAIDQLPLTVEERCWFAEAR